MIVLADNDILIKLAGCNLLKEFLDSLNANLNSIFITNEAKYSIKKYATRQIIDDKIRDELIDFIGKLPTIPKVSDDLLAQIQSIDKERLNGGEVSLVLAMDKYTDANFITGDKKFLNALMEHKNNLVISKIITSLEGKVYSLESALLYLIDVYGFNYVSERVINRCIEENTLKNGFSETRTFGDAIDCLSSECRKILPLLTNINLYKELE